MFDRFVTFLKQFDGPQKRAGLSQDDPRVAAAALMFHVVYADGVGDESELNRLRGLLAETYDLSGDALESTIAAGEQADQEAIDLYSFTSVLKRHLDDQGRRDLIGILWEVVYADGEMHELEDDTVSRVAELLGVEPRERVELRREAKARALGRAH